MFQLQIIGPDEKVQCGEILDGHLCSVEIWSHIMAWAQTCKSLGAMRVQVQDENGRLIARMDVGAVPSRADAEP